ncbi:MAG: heme exporter protein CcmB [Gammaproteobacteria bacterium]|nr:heme exporter protein CcmB [Gammaproteobacteria bacterium]
MLKTLSHVFYSELLVLIRRSQEWLYPLGFFIIMMSLLPLVFSPDPLFLKKYVPGYIWLAALLASLLAIETIFYADLEDGYLEQLILSPLPLPCIISIKLLAQWLITQLPLILLTPLIGFLFHLSFLTIAVLSLTLLIGTPILTLLGSLGVALTLGLRQSGVLLGLLFLPLVTPVIIFGVTSVQQIQAGFSIAAPLCFLIGLLFLAITFLPLSIAATLRISMDD